MEERKSRKGLYIFLVILLIVLCTAGFFGYKYLSANIDMFSKELYSYDDRYTMSVPYSWKASSGASPYAVMAAENKDNSMYAMVSVYKDITGNGLTVEEYIYGYINQIAENSDNPLVQVMSIPPTQGQLGENVGYYFELDSMSDGLAIHLWDFVYVADGGYVHVNVASSGEKIATSADIAKGIIASVKSNDYNAQAPA
ncbi:MAG: hypothetical protein IKV96_03090 [Firmicutes bacterium]|nr:hypothetical protein [Bacillota bacterium]